MTLMMSDDEPALPWSVHHDCENPDCPRTHRHRWPADNPDSITYECYWCGTENTVRREESEEVVP